MIPKELEKVRIDKWLWAVRIFKTRALAKAACETGKVKIAGDSVKPGKFLHGQEEVHIRIRYEIKIYVVEKLIERRVAASIAVICYKDLSPVDESAPKLRSAFYRPDERPKGSGRPTKKERREIDRFKGEDEKK